MLGIVINRLRTDKLEGKWLGLSHTAKLELRAPSHPGPCFTNLTAPETCCILYSGQQIIWLTKQVWRVLQKNKAKIFLGMLSSDLSVSIGWQETRVPMSCWMTLNTSLKVSGSVFPSVKCGQELLIPTPRESVDELERGLGYVYPI